VREAQDTWPEPDETISDMLSLDCSRSICKTRFLPLETAPWRLPRHGLGLTEEHSNYICKPSATLAPWQRVRRWSTSSA